MDRDEVAAAAERERDDVTAEGPRQGFDLVAVSREACLLRAAEDLRRDGQEINEANLHRAAEEQRREEFDLVAVAPRGTLRRAGRFPPGSTPTRRDVAIALVEMERALHRDGYYDYRFEACSDRVRAVWDARLDLVRADLRREMREAAARRLEQLARVDRPRWGVDADDERRAARLARAFVLDLIHSRRACSVRYPISRAPLRTRARRRRLRAGGRRVCRAPPGRESGGDEPPPAHERVAPRRARAAV
jgi:hypothetical protein